ncbi:MAG: hypothetical protein AB1351_12090 [Thermoproteota archaeon]
MNSFYATLYAKFADLQVDQSFSAKFVYPAANPLPMLKIGKEISDCTVRIPPVKANGRISYGPFVFEDGEFGQASAVRLAMASTCLLSGKSVFSWLYRECIKEWLASKGDPVRAGYVVNMILDSVARQRIRQVGGEDFYADIVQAADRLASALLPKSHKDLGSLAEATIASYMLRSPIHAPSVIAKAAQNFVTQLDALAFDPSRLVDMLRDRMSDGMVQVGREESGWDRIVRAADRLYSVIEGVPGKWHSAYLPHSNPVVAGSLNSVFISRTITEKELPASKNHDNGDAMWQEIFFEMTREEHRNEKARSRMTKAVQGLNLGRVGFPSSDYVSYYRLFNELAPQIRQMIERVRQVKNMLDENMMEESGNIDLQIAIQAIASETTRNDIFTKDENLLKNESWTILVDSSLSLSWSSREVKAVSICLAETAREIMGSNPWGMFAFSDDLYCIKDYVEPYGTPVKARIGGMTQGGLSHIPDAMRACRKMIAEHACDRNYLILVSDGIPSGYPGIEAEFAISVKELARYGVDLAAISVASSGIKKTIRKARIVEKPADLVKEFMEIYYGLSS